MITGHDIVCLSTQDWDDLWTRKQRFMLRLAAQGNRVLYVETQASLVSRSLLRSDPGRAVRWRQGPRPVRPNLSVATLPLVLPAFQMSRAVNAINNAVLARLLRRWMGQLDFRDVAVWAYTPHSHSIIERLRPALAIYECVDEFSASRGLVRASVVSDLERRLLARVDVTVVTHENLARSKAHQTREIHVVPNGADVDHFGTVGSPDTVVAPSLGSLPRPIVGFLGSVQYWIDFELLHALAQARPQWSFVLVGPVGRLARVDRLQGLRNVVLTGRVPYTEVPTYVKAFDVCLNPYRMDEVAINCSPLKLYEYLASGKPVVSVDMPAARQFGDAVSIGRDAGEILRRLDAALAVAEDPRAAEARRAVAAQHSWDRRFEQVQEVLAPHFDRVAARPQGN